MSPVFSSRQFDGFQQELSTLLLQELLMWLRHWPLVTGTVYVNIPKAGRLSVDLQRTYYIEQIITADNFQANLLTIRWTRDF